MQAVHVAVGVVLDKAQRVLISRRASASHQGGLWEFPGGKVEAAESVVLALARELQEELGILIGRTSPLLEIHHDYGDKTVLLDVHVVWDFSGEARGLEGQPLAWVAPNELQRYTFPAANRPIIAALVDLVARQPDFPSC
jgi:8-oxo-dGTP diphosphatase